MSSDDPTSRGRRHSESSTGRRRGGSMGGVRQIVDGVFEVRFRYVHAHLVVVEDGVVLVDTGLPGRSVAFGRALAELRRRIGEVRTILLTHRHIDHTGGVAELRRRSGARVVAHALDAPAVAGATVVPERSLVPRLAVRIMGRAEPAPVDDVLTGDGPAPAPGFTALHTPGHTAGHVSYLLDRGGGVLFAGDAAMGGRRPRQTLRMTAEDPAMQARNVARLAELDFEAAVFGHGRAVTERAADRFRELAAR